jgi:predicted O-methyltransferase YrrM
MREKLRAKAVHYFLRMHEFLGLYNLLNIERNTVTLNNFEELKKIFNWTDNPILVGKDIDVVKNIEDVNDRKIRDAESLALVMINRKPKIAVEIGTADGGGTLLMASNSPNCKIYTVNILPEEIEKGKGGKFTTFAIEKEKIGKQYKEKNIKNIIQIFANSAYWEPKGIGIIDVAFIDGCHDTKFVFNDTKKILKHMKPGSFILWHDFNPTMMKKYYWIFSVCKGIEKLYKKGYIKGKIFHIKDSWVGIYQVK